MEEIAVKVTPALGNAVPVLIPADSTIRQAVEAAGFSTDGLTARRNGGAVDYDATVAAGDNIILVKQIKGN